MNKIFVDRPTKETVDCAGVAFSEDGDEIAFHVSSSHSFFQYDMGLKTKDGIGGQKHEKYAEHCPYGYELVEVIGRDAMQSHIDSGEIRGLYFGPAPGGKEPE